jgi:hypothetical protein
MADDSPTGFAPEVQAALDSFVGAGCPGEVNDYLDEAGLEHPQLHHEERDSPPTKEAIAELPCGPGFKSERTWVLNKNTYGGHWFWSCVPE